MIEPYVSVRANPMTDLLLRGRNPAGRGALARAWDNGDDREARDDMALASLLGGLALANAGLGAVHGFAAPLGGMFPAPHGAVCAAVLPHAMRINVQALRQRAPESQAWHATAKSAACSPAARKPPPRMASSGCATSAASWRFPRCAPTA